MNRIMYISLILFIISSCKKEQNTLPTELPPITTVGKNTFGCIIENEIYIPEIRRQSLNIPINIEFPKYPNYRFSVTTIRLINKNDNVMDAEVVLYANSIKDTGNYKFLYTTTKYNNTYYHSDSLNNGILKIVKFDTINKIISGKFYFKSFDENLNFINITKGRFDLKK